MSETKTKSSQQPVVQTTGHAWDGDIQEFNNPIPNWWLWSFYTSVVFAVVYWVFYPAWPIGDSYTKGVMNNITFLDSKGQEQTMHWNTRALLIKEMQDGKNTEIGRSYLQKVSQSSYQEILNDPEMIEYTLSVAKGLYGDNCAACHGSGAAGVVGLFPNLADDDWLWGGSTAEIEETIADGHLGYMPGFKKALNDKQIDDVTHYVLSLSGLENDAASAKLGKAIFQGKEGGCYYCHTAQGTGLKSQGAANLTDAIWTVADVNGASTTEERKQAVKWVINNGVSRRMPAWSGRLSKEQIKLLTVYVHELGGGQ
ncbi:MAG: cytochrome-c oxidase, cbb3-type subunit III [Gammaproteobacteria bacterium]